MKRNIVSKYWILLFVPLFWSCAAKKKLKEVKQEKIVKENEISTNDLKKTQLDYETFTAKAKTNLSLDGKVYDVTLNLRNKKSEIIWVSLTYVAGLEAVRVLITPDSVRLLNRMTSEYAVYPFKFIHRYTSKQIDFKALEAMLVGNSLDLLLGSDPSITKENGLLLLKGNSADLMFESVYSSLFKPQSLSLKKQMPAQSLNINYDSYTQIEGKLVPFKIGIASQIESKEIKIGLEYQNPQFNIPLEYPFTIPKRFTHIE